MGLFVEWWNGFFGKRVWRKMSNFFSDSCKVYGFFMLVDGSWWCSYTEV